MAEDTDTVCGSHSREARTLCREKVGGDSAERMILLRPDRAMVQTDRRLRDASCTRPQTCHGILTSWTTPPRPRAIVCILNTWCELTTDGCTEGIPQPVALLY